MKVIGEQDVRCNALKKAMQPVLKTLLTPKAKFFILSLLCLSHLQGAYAASLDLNDDYLKEIFGTPVPTHLSATEAATKKQLKPPLPELMVDNGPAPLPNLTSPLKIVQSKPQTGLLAAFSARNLLWPMRGGLVSSRFGWRSGRMHQGTDISAPYGTPILAAGDGKVVFSGWESGYGQLMIVDHGNGTKTKYGHCSQLLAFVGQSVKQGQVIGKVGSTGHSTGPHLHYEVIRSGQASNPENFTRRR